MHKKTQGIVLRQVKFKESDKILTIFSRENGKISAIAKGARKTKSPLMGSTQVFCYSDFVLYRGKSFYHVNQGEVLNSFYSLRNDLYKLAYGTYILEIVEAGITEEESNEKVFLLLLKTLNVLSVIEDDFLKLVLAFIIKFLSFMGYKPHLRRCVVCNNNLMGRIKFSISQGGVLCDKCKNSDLYALSLDLNTVKAMDNLLYAKLDNLDEVQIPESTLLNIEKILTKYLLAHIDKKTFKSLDFIKSIPK
ncbi:DNA repair protein RecO [Sporosalibacterium faouarense]|uniref:DNA repair protein RecO n=1 Tax=Sporosalibacterium faouarense TaxID=516123 RepID=UPI00141CFCC4|nr:DNA repair protein RecO [Sporosalibacterium faouarense]MTI49418.1 DNA repair protein RecO [Bacillota bacterium]